MWAVPVAFLVVLVWAQPSVGTDSSLIAASGAALLVWVLHSWWFPRAKCRYCGPRGGPRRTDSSESFWHDCLYCGGSGKRTRFWARIFGGVDD
jgi:hypothetical protein